MGIGGSRSFRRFLLPFALALCGCPFSADGDGDRMNAGEGGSAGSGGMSGDTGAGTGGTGGDSGGTGGDTGGTGGTGGVTAGTGGTGGDSGGTGGTGGSLAADDGQMLIPECGQVGAPSDPLEVLEAHLEGHILFVTVQHSGGCEAHDYSLCHSPDWTGWEPSQTSLNVLHDAMGDSCEALITQELTFDLRVLGSYYENRVGKRAGSIELSLRSTDLLYVFDLDADEPDPGFAALDTQLEQANHCESVDECVPVHLPPCATRYVSANEDVEALQSALDAWGASEGLDQAACLLPCHCGLLTCTEGKCTTAEDSGCDGPESSTDLMVCL